MRELEYHHTDIVWAIIWGPNKVIDIGEWSVYMWSVIKVLLNVHIYAFICLNIYNVYIYIYTVKAL